MSHRVSEMLIINIYKYFDVYYIFIVNRAFYFCFILAFLSICISFFSVSEFVLTMFSCFYNTPLLDSYNEVKAKGLKVLLSFRVVFLCMRILTSP